MTSEPLLRMGKGHLIGVESGPERSAGLSSGLAPPVAKMPQEFPDIPGLGRLGEGVAREGSSVVVGSSEPDLAPRLRVGRLESRRGAEALDVGGLEIEEMARHDGEEAVLPAVHPLEMPEEQRKPHDVDRAEFVLKSAKRRADAMGDAMLLKILLEFVDVGAELLDLTVLAFRNPPDQQGDPAPILGEKGRDRLAQKDAGEIGYLQASADRVIIREGDEIHPDLTEPGVQLPRNGNAGRYIETTEQPLW